VPCLLLDGVLLGTREHSRALHDGAAGGVLGGYLAGTHAVPLGSLECAFAAARPRAARAVPSCAGAYVSGAAGSNACPAGSVRIATEAACRTAAAAAGKTAGLPFVETDPYTPRGCYYVSTSTSVYNNYAYFNPHPVGFGDTLFRLLCTVTSGAPPPPPPPPPPARARVYTGACSGTVHVQRRARELHAPMRALQRCGGAAGYSRGTGYCTGLVGSASVGRALPCGSGADVSPSIGQRWVVRGASQSGTLQYSAGTHGVLCGTHGQRIGRGGQSTAEWAHLIVLTVRHCSDTHCVKLDGPSVQCTRWSGVE
jgi:hypothetical protein